MTEFEDRLLALLRPIFPKHADFRPRRDFSDITVGIDWKLGSDPERPNKRSKTVIIEIGEAFIDDWIDGPPGTKVQMESRLVAWARDRMRSFEAEHDAKAFELPPRERWQL